MSQTMKKLSCMTDESFRQIKVVLTDIDDTLTTHGQLTSSTYNALENLKKAGLIVIPVTGRSAGWCDHIARMWPVDAVVGENGAFYFRYDSASKIMHKIFSHGNAERMEDVKKLHSLRTKIELAVPGCKVASDQDYRIADLAIDVAEDVKPLSPADVNRIVALAEDAGATAKVSSIHVNCWFGHHTKLSASLKALEECFGFDLQSIQSKVIFVGDSPNDANMFGYFDFSIGVANVLDTLDILTERPTFITEKSAGTGFIEIANRLLDAQGFSIKHSNSAEVGCVD